MAGRPAVTRNQFERGLVFYAGTDSAEVGFYEALAQQAGSAAHLQPLLGVPRGVEVTTRETADETYYFLLNFVDSTHEIRLPHAMEELISQHQLSQISLAPLGVAILAEKRS